MRHEWNLNDVTKLSSSHYCADSNSDHEWKPGIVVKWQIQDFLDGGCQPQRFWRKLHENERNWKGSANVYGHNSFWPFDKTICSNVQIANLLIWMNLHAWFNSYADNKVQNSFGTNSKISTLGKKHIINISGLDISYTFFTIILNFKCCAIPKLEDLSFTGYIIQENDQGNAWMSSIGIALWSQKEG